MKHLKTYNLFEDVYVNKDNLQRLKDYFNVKDITQIFDDNFIQTISDICLEFDDLGYEVGIYFPLYSKEGSTDRVAYQPSCCIDIYSESNHFLDNVALEMTIKEIQSFVSDFNLSVDIELKSDDQIVTSDEFISQYNVEGLDAISILIY